MAKYLSAVFIIAVLSATGALAMPLGALPTTQSELYVPVGSGCGIGVRRGPLGGCDPPYIYDGNGAYERGYRHGYYRGYHRGYYEGYHDGNYPYVSDSGYSDVVNLGAPVCGFGSYLACSYGTCWRLCY
jgi:hypothetical protein